jgi:DNA modification methylase
MYTLHHGNCVDVLKQIPGDSIDSVVTDPPYELGFMGKRWDASGIAYSIALWTEVLRVLKPGGHLLAFGGTRTYHRMTCAIEDAGFDIRDSLHWMYGSGFPKSLNIGAGWGTGLKPAHEPIVLARKPLIHTVAETFKYYGTGAMNIDACRIGTEERINPPATPTVVLSKRGDIYALTGMRVDAQPTLARGRWPSNILLDEDAAAELDVQSGQQKSGTHIGHNRDASVSSNHIYGSRNNDTNDVGYGDSGGASRFFYVAKPSRKERELGCELLPPKTAVEAVGRDPNSAGALNARAGAGRSAGARIMRCAKCDSEVNEGRYETISGLCDDGESHDWEHAGTCEAIHNYHPTVKPITLMRYLVKLITPINGRVLDPFVGSGSTGCAAVLEGFGFIGIDLSEEYLTIAKARISYWQDVKDSEPESLF